MPDRRFLIRTTLHQEQEMIQEIAIKIGGHTYSAELLDTHTACAICNALPMNAKINRWGGEIYFPITIECDLEPESREILQAGELAYWPAGPAFCIFFGPTVISQASEIRAASAVNIFGKVTSEISGLWNTKDGQQISIVKI